MAPAQASAGRSIRNSMANRLCFVVVVHLDLGDVGAQPGHVMDDRVGQPAVVGSDGGDDDLHGQVGKRYCPASGRCEVGGGWWPAGRRTSGSARSIIGHAGRCRGRQPGSNCQEGSATKPWQLCRSAGYDGERNIPDGPRNLHCAHRPVRLIDTRSVEPISSRRREPMRQRRAAIEAESARACRSRCDRALVCIPGEAARRAAARWPSAGNHAMNKIAGAIMILAGAIAGHGVLVFLASHPEIHKYDVPSSVANMVLVAMATAVGWPCGARAHVAATTTTASSGAVHHDVSTPSANGACRSRLRDSGRSLQACGNNEWAASLRTDDASVGVQARRNKCRQAIKYAVAVWQDDQFSPPNA